MGVSQDSAFVLGDELVYSSFSITMEQAVAAAYREAGGELLVCGPCAQSRKIDPKNDFVDGASIVNGPTFVKEFLSATNVLVY